MSDSLCDTFQELAAETWSTLEWAERCAMRWSEETATETLLRELQLRHPGAIIIEPASKREEAIHGADWEWWIGGAGRWLGMRVQAKRIKVAKEAFLGLQSYRPLRGGPRQIENLISVSRGEGLNPVYCLYAYAPRWASSPFLAPPFRLPSGGFSGCMIGHAQTVQSIRANALKRLSPWLQPWHRLVCPGEHPSPSRLADVAYEALKNGFGRHALFADEEGREPALFAPRKQLPSYLRHIERDVLDASGMKEITVEGDAAERGIRGFVIVRGDDATGD